MKRPKWYQTKSDGKLWRAGKHWFGLCAAWNHATRPYVPLLEEEHKRARIYARAIKNRMSRFGYVYGVHYIELSNGSLWPIQPKKETSI